MRNWQHAWGTKKDGTEWHHMTFFTNYVMGSLVSGDPPSKYDSEIILTADYDDCNMPTPWEPV